MMWKETAVAESRYFCFSGSFTDKKADSESDKRKRICWDVV